MSLWRFGRVLPDAPAVLEGPDWRQADPRWIQRALGHALARPTGGWAVLDASRAIDGRARRHRAFGRDWVAFRASDGSVICGPDACPHLGAALAGACVREDHVVCPWHGLALGARPRGAWRPVPTHDDGVLVWARFEALDPHTGPTPTDAPILSARPTGPQLDAVVRLEAACEARDMIENRLDPWHGAHYHPHSFATLKVLARTDEDITVRVAYRVAGPLAVEVDARFHSPEPRCITMTIVDGEGTGSVVETHATPLDEGRSAVIEATLATSERPGFAWSVRWFARWMRPFAEARARRLWIEDCAYAERRCSLRLLAHRDDVPEAAP